MGQVDYNQRGRGRSEKQTLISSFYTDLAQSTLISCRLWALNSATSHSSHKQSRCKVNSIDNYCSAWISRPLLCDLEVTAAKEVQCVLKSILDIVLTNPNFKPGNSFYQEIKFIQCKTWMRFPKTNASLTWHLNPQYYLDVALETIGSRIHDQFYCVLLLFFITTLFV